MQNFKFYLSLLFIACIAFSCSQNKYKDVQNTEQDYYIIPEVSQKEMMKGKFLLTSSTQIVAAKGLEKVSSYLLTLLGKPTGYELTVSEEGEKNNAIRLMLSDSVEQEEGYRLDVTPENITITAKTEQGLFYGIQTLRQLLPPEIESNTSKTMDWTVPSVKIVDAPRYSYRGMHLDVGRHFFPPAFVKKYIDLIAMHKMNTFHWHLTEDQGWRIEIKKYPKLTQIGSKREKTLVGFPYQPFFEYLHKNKIEHDDIPDAMYRFFDENPPEFDNKVHEGFYTQEEIKDIVQYAADRYITIIPEIEMPGHALAALASYPEFGNTKTDYKVATLWGVHSAIFAPKEETFKFLEDVLTEVIALFPSQLIHIGGDEAPKKEWKQSAQAQSVIKREGLKNEYELQSYFIKRIEKFLNSKGRNIIGWDEILEGGLAPNATVMSWRGVKGGIEAAKQKHNVVMTPTTFCYFDYYQAEPVEEEPIGIGGMITVEKVYGYDPNPKELSPEEQKYILGVQGNVWTEYIPTSSHLEYMALPRMTALSEVAWTNTENKDWNKFKNKFPKFAQHLDLMGVNYAKHILKKNLFSDF